MRILSIKYWLLVLCLFLVSIWGFAQKPTDDLVAMNKRFNSMETFDISVEVKVYKKDADKTPSFLSKGRTVKSGTKFYLNMLNRKTVINNGLMLVVDAQQKMMLYRAIAKEEMAKIANPDMMNIDSIVRSQKADVKFLVNNGTERKIEVKGSSDEFRSVTMSYDPKTYQLKEIVYYYSDEMKKISGNARIVVTYSDFSLECKNPAVFDQSVYIRKNGNTYTGYGAYKSYKVVNPENYIEK